MVDKFLSSNKTEIRLARTIFQGIIGVLIANIDVIFSSLKIPGDERALIVAITMAILTPIMGAISSNGKDIQPYLAGGEGGEDDEVGHEEHDPSDPEDGEDA